MPSAQRRRFARRAALTLLCFSLVFILGQIAIGYSVEHSWVECSRDPDYDGKPVQNAFAENFRTRLPINRSSSFWAVRGPRWGSAQAGHTGDSRSSRIVRPLVFNFGANIRRGSATSIRLPSPSARRRDSSGPAGPRSAAADTESAERPSCRGGLVGRIAVANE